MGEQTSDASIELSRKPKEESGESLSPETKRKLVSKFGREIVQVFEGAMDEIENMLGHSAVPLHKNLRKVMKDFPMKKQMLMVAQCALEVFIHDLMARFDESSDFKLVGNLDDGKEVDLRTLCPEGLHGNQLDWFEAYSKYKDIYAMSLEATK